MKQFYTAPTLIRALIGAGDQYLAGHDKSSLRVLGSVGEPINPVAWHWFHKVTAALAPPALPSGLLPHSSNGSAPHH